MNPKLPLDGRIYILTVGSVLTTNVSQINLCQLLFKATLKLRLDSCLSLLLEWTTLHDHQNECTFRKIHSLSQRGHSITHAYVRIQATPFFSLKNQYGHGRTSCTIAAGPDETLKQQCAKFVQTCYHTLSCGFFKKGKTCNETGAGSNG